MKRRFKFSHRGGDRYYWVCTTRVPNDSRSEHVSCAVDWYWTHQ